MQYYGFDWLACLCVLLGMFLLGSRSKYGFVFCMLGSSSWLVVGFLIGSLPLIFGSLIQIVLQIRGLINWRRQENKSWLEPRQIIMKTRNKNAPTEWRQGDYIISTEQARIDTAFCCGRNDYLHI